MGLHDIEKKLKLERDFRKKGTELFFADLGKMLTSLKELRGELKKFEKKYAKELKTIPSYREKVVRMREELGLPLEIGVYEEKGKPRLFGKDKYYDKLGLEALDILQKHKETSGGIISLAEIVLLVNKETPGVTISPDDINKALKRLEKADLVNIFELKSSDVKIVEFIPVGLSSDQNEVLELASINGWTTLEEVMMEKGWSKERSERVLKAFKDGGIARIDSSYARGTRYYFPGLGGSSS
ncbi:EAP30/Vps36 family vacuolar-sorting protein [Candidatus Borrarchaeum sp.]|uniref:EAP30/Vps36 family vacuolar-sorting protein n=1 Tax=Candidatus Borrarchaeum sp. TaxID=2846742 RepID=UPI00257C54C2|nr:EAP30/Vps36 family vacuolar-sorting protein [Candidatus Borrarchaeum sp.]